MSGLGWLLMFVFVWIVWLDLWVGLLGWVLDLVCFGCCVFVSLLVLVLCVLLVLIRLV